MGNSTKKPWLPPRWFIRFAWQVHRRVYRWTGGRLGLWHPKRKGWGVARLTTTGRRTGQERSVMIGYYVDGDDVVTLAMNGWGDGEPAWWLNLQAHPEATLELKDGERRGRAHAAEGDESERLWARWQAIDPETDAFAANRSTETAVVVLAPLD